jgi:site-specific recombinase XerD
LIYSFEKQYQAHRDALLRQGMSPATIEAYSRSVRRVFSETGRLPGDLGRRDLEKYFAHLVKTHSWSTIKIDRNGLRFFYHHVLGREWEWIDICKPRRAKTLPVVLNTDEVDAVIHGIREFRYRTCVLALYSMGLRLREGLKLQVGDIDSKRMMVHIRAGKGMKDRYVPLPAPTLLYMRAYWKTHRNPDLIFPATGGLRMNASVTKTVMDAKSLQKAMTGAVRECGIKKNATIHSLRHSYATHLLEAGVHLRVIGDYMGHSSILTTAKYTHMTNVIQKDSTEVIARLMQRYMPTRN